MKAVGVALVVAALCAEGGAARTRAQPGAWNLVHARPSGAKYNDFAFPSATHGWLISAAGVILHTTDGGATWTEQATGKGSLRSVDFLDNKRGYAGTLTGTLHATTDGGVTWNDITATLPGPPKGFCGMTHVGDRLHFVGRYIGDAADYFYSPDGGRTWTLTDLKPQMQGLVDVVFLDASVGFIGGMSHTGPPRSGPAAILKTTDGGKTWRDAYTDVGGGRGFVWKIFPVTAKLIYAALQSQDGTYRVAKSTNGGDTWEVQIAATGRPQGPAVQGIGFVDEHTGWIGGFFAGMYGTTDGGRTWTPVPTPDFTLNRFELVNGRTLFTAGSRGILRYDKQ